MLSMGQSIIHMHLSFTLDGQSSNPIVLEWLALLVHLQHSLGFHFNIYYFTESKLLKRSWTIL